MQTEYIFRVEQQRPSCHLGLASPLKLLKHQLNRHHCGWLHYWGTRRVRLDHSNHLLLLFSGLSDFPLRWLYMEVCVQTGGDASLQNVWVCANVCRRILSFCLPSTSKNGSTETGSLLQGRLRMLSTLRLIWRRSQLIKLSQHLR